MRLEDFKFRLWKYRSNSYIKHIKTRKINSLNNKYLSINLTIF